MDGVQFIVAGHHFKVPDSETSACVVRKEPRSVSKMYAVHHWPNFVVCGGYIVLGACHVRKKPESLALALAIDSNASMMDQWP